MRDRFVADVGDFGKYGMLRALCRDDLRLGVVWCFVRDRMLDYLKRQERFKECDEELFRALGDIADNCRRKVATIETSGLLPTPTAFYPEEVPSRTEMRKAWVDRALEQTAGCEVVFFDPDNGLKGGDVPRSRASSKHLYCGEIRPFARNRQSLIVYHHLNMSQPHGDQIRSVAKSFAGAVDGSRVWALCWTSYGPRAYFVAPSGREAVLRPRIAALLDGPWGDHFEPVLFP